MWTSDISDAEWKAIKKAKVVDISDIVKENIIKTELRDFIRNAMKEVNNGAIETSDPNWLIDFQGNKKERKSGNRFLFTCNINAYNVYFLHCRSGK